MDTEILLKELTFKATRSSGAGGQHVNKVSSKIALYFDLDNSKAFSANEKELLFKSLANRLTKENILQLSSEESRSQHKNKQLVIQRFLDIISQGLVVPKKRKATQPSKAALKKLAVKKKKQSLKKALRKKPPID